MGFFLLLLLYIFISMMAPPKDLSDRAWVTNRAFPSRAWVTLLTRPSYLPGVITLAYSLQTVFTRYPLVVLVTQSLTEPGIQALKFEAAHNPFIIVHYVGNLIPPSGGPKKLIASRFEDTWTKLRAFELTACDRCVFLDADITVFRNMDELFDLDLPADWIAASHGCVCNRDGDAWAKKDWNQENCAWTPIQHPDSVDHAVEVPSTAAPDHPLALLNGGLFVYNPSPALWESLHNHFLTSPNLSKYNFPDQDFLDDFFHAKWVPLPWKFNALKTMRQWHTNIWRDDMVHGLHYIVDKPWSNRIASDGIAGYLGRDGETHSWWWKIWDEWRVQREVDRRLLGYLDMLVAPELDEDSDRAQCEKNREMGYPTPLRGGQTLSRVRLADRKKLWSAFANGNMIDMIVGDNF